jgi:hypothetical protein
MNSVLKTALVVGVAIAVEALVLERLFVGLQWGIFVGAFLVAIVFLVVLQYALSQRRLIRLSYRWRRQPWQEPASPTRNGLEPSSAPATHSIAAAEDNGAPLMERVADAALPDEDGIINKESS